MRNSNQRNLVYDIVMSSCDHPTAEDIYLKAKIQMPKISLGTVYRNLNELVESKKILRISVPGDNDRFDKTLSHHAHLYCEKCNSLVDIMNIDVTKWINEINQNEDITVLSSEINFKGICQKCQLTKK